VLYCKLFGVSGIEHVVKIAQYLNLWH